LSEPLLGVSTIFNITFSDNFVFTTHSAEDSPDAIIRFSGSDCLVPENDGIAKYTRFHNNYFTQFETPVPAEARLSTIFNISAFGDAARLSQFLEADNNTFEHI